MGTQPGTPGGTASVPSGSCPADSVIGFDLADTEVRPRQKPITPRAATECVPAPPLSRRQAHAGPRHSRNTACPSA
ncbi:MAG: hypothetical protein BWZ02_03094 [Lentisphaerae bacterium ADurb.BinA184]|nr:MAG: hypothetical protein BWZ02_03094 [Lentisphaerae bacterium ADurb.BinA184]